MSEAKAAAKPAAPKAQAAPAGTVASAIAAGVQQTPETKREIGQLAPIRMQEAEFLRSSYVCTAMPDTKPGDLEHQAYWAHVAPLLKPWARIEVRADDASWYAEAVVLEAGRNWANVKVLNVWNLTNADIARTSAAISAEYAGLPYEVRFRGEHELWSVIRKSDNAVMHEKEGTKAGADHWIRERMKADRPGT